MASSLDERLKALANPTRRRLLVGRAEHNPQSDDDLHLPEDVPVSETDQEGFQIEMCHIHLPKVEDSGLIHWDRDSHQVTNGPEFDEIRPILQSLEDDSDNTDSDE